MTNIYILLTIACFLTFGEVNLGIASTGNTSSLLPASNPSGQAYEYLIEGRPDPFKPFLSPKAASTTTLDPNEIIDDTSELSGMQLFEPGQLILVGILTHNKGRIAMVEDQTKKGYTIKIGTLIGKRGVVSDIQNNEVIITETARTRAGKEMTNTITMRLSKEGEK